MNFPRELVMVPELSTKSGNEIDLDAYLLLSLEYEDTWAIGNYIGKIQRRSRHFINDCFFERIKCEVMRPPFYLIRKPKEIRRNLELNLGEGSHTTMEDRIEPSLSGDETMNLGEITLQPTQDQGLRPISS